jgi:effector-binding domain-containing protein
MIEEPQIVERPPQEVALLHIKTLRSDMQRVMGPGINEVMAAAQSQGIGPTGPWFAHHLRMTPESFDFDICVPVSRPVAAVGRVIPWERPPLKVALTVYRGPYEGLGHAWHEFGQWLRAHGHASADDLYECYLVGPSSSSDPADWCTELCRPLVG